MRRVEGGAKLAVVRRRSYTREFRRQVVKETLAPGAPVSAVALKHGLNTNMLFSWRRRYLRELTEAQTVNLLSVAIEASGSVAPRARPEPIAIEPRAGQPSFSGGIEIAVYGACIRIQGVVQVAALRAVLEALSGR